jgi:hypothetical protein
MNRAKTYFQDLAPLSHASAHGATHDASSWTSAAMARYGATLAWVAPSVLAWLSCADCYGATDRPYVIWCMDANVVGATQVFKPPHNPFFFLSSLFPSSPLSLSQPSDPAAAAPFTTTGRLHPATIRPKTRSFSSPKVASPFESCRFSFYYLYCFV